MGTATEIRLQELALQERRARQMKEEGITTTLKKIGPNGDVEHEVRIPPFRPGGGPVGASNPPIDHEKVERAREHEADEEESRKQEEAVDRIAAAALQDKMDSEEEAHVRKFIEIMEDIREERKDLNDRKADAKADLVKHCPDLDFTALMIAYNIYVAAESEQEAGGTMKHTAATIEKLSRIWAQPTLFDA